MLYTDGATRPTNPGPSGYGAVLLEGDGEETEVRNGFLGDDVTNNQAEYAGLLAGLELVDQFDLSRAIVCSDSKLVVNQLTAGWAVNSARLRDLWKEADKRLAALGPGIRLTHVTGHVGITGNEMADGLAADAVEVRNPAPQWILDLVDRGTRMEGQRKGHELLADLTMSWLQDRDIPTFRYPGVSDGHQRALLRNARDVGARLLLDTPMLVTILPRLGTCLIAAVTGFARKDGAMMRAISEDLWEALSGLQRAGHTVLVVHKPYNGVRWQHDIDLRWGILDKEELAMCARLTDVKTAAVVAPGGWGPTVTMDASWIPFISFMRQVLGS